MMKKSGIVLLIALLLLSVYMTRLYVPRDKQSGEFVQKYLEECEAVVNCLMDDFEMNCEDEEAAYIVSRDKKGDHLITRCFGKEGDISDRTAIEAMKEINAITYYPIDGIYVTKDRITFVAGLGMEGIIYMKNDRKPDYFISPDRQERHHRIYRLDAHWYHVEVY